MKLRRPLKAELLSRVSIGSWITIPHPAIAEILVRAGFDWLTIDLEHSPTTLETAAEMIRTIDLAGVSPFVRVGSHDANVIKRVMDAGAHGIIASTVNTAEEARNIVAAVKYPPLGGRGVGLSRAQGYADEFEEHYKWLNSESIVFVQIEHIRAVENLAEILAVSGVDGFFIGPYDLSASLGVAGQFEHPLMRDALNRINTVRAKTPSVPGVHVVPTDPQQVLQKVKEGYRFIAYGLDFLFLKNKAREGLEAVRGAL